MSERKALEEMLEKEFGIKSERELDRALKEMKKIDISVFVQRVAIPDKRRRKLCSQ